MYSKTSIQNSIRSKNGDSRHIFSNSQIGNNERSFASVNSSCPSYCLPTCPTSCSSVIDPYCVTQPPANLKEIRCGRGSTEKFLSKFELPTVPIPSWMAYCGMVMNFYAYFQEPIPESPLETYRIHRCEIRYYLEDDTIEVVEPPTFDPGYTQGRVINRCRIQLPPPCDDSYFTLEHLTVGCEVTFYARTFHICGCDKFTRGFLNKLGYPVQPNTEVPYDPATVKRQDMVTSQFARRAGINLEKKKTEKFLTNNRKVLRFWGYWDDRCSQFGVLRRFTLSYFLEDDTIGITEILKPNSGFDHYSTFLGRAKLPKDTSKIVPIPGIKEEALLVLNVVGVDKCGCITHSFISDRLCPGINEPEYYKDVDLAIGATINVYGRCFILTDCDEFTKRYYRDKYGIEDFTPLVMNEGLVDLPRMETPPHIWIGNEEDTLANWDRIQISPPKKDDILILLNDKDVLGFSAQLHKVLQKVNSVRRFTIRYFMVDGTVQIFEKEHPNTGLKKGLFLARMRIKKGGTLDDQLSGKKTEYFGPQDFFVGAVLNLNGFNFLITEADEFTLGYMERHYSQFSQSNLCSVLNKMREACGPLQAADILFAFSEKDTKCQGVQDFRDFRELVLKISQCALSEHEIITLKRAYKVQAPEPGPDFSTLKTVIQTELKRYHFDKRLIERIEYTLRHHDPCRQGLVDRETLRSALKGAKIPIAKELVNFLVDRWPAADECNRVNYCEIIRFLDWETNGGMDAMPTALPCVLKWIEPKPPNEIRCVNYRAFLEDICPNIKCALPLLCCPGEQNCESSCPRDQDECCQPETCENSEENHERNNENQFEGWNEFYGE